MNESNSIELLKYPIGQFKKPSKITDEDIKKWINDIEVFPFELRSTIQELDAQELSNSYRVGGWNIAQIVHHCADSHINSFVRFKLALTENAPTIKPYMEDHWAKLPDYQISQTNASLILIEGLHKRWCSLLRSLTSEDLMKTFFHPEHQKYFQLDENIGIYAWHCKHHLEHIKLALKS